MTLSTAWSSAEDEALEGLPWSAQLLYLRGLRRFMDYGSGIVGVRRRISWQGLREVLHVQSHQGLEEVALTKGQLRRAVSWLEKAGLVEVRTEGKVLVFYLPLADMDESAQKKAVPRPYHVRTTEHEPKAAPKAAPRNASNGAGCEENPAPKDEPKAVARPYHQEEAKAVLHPVSGVPVNPSTSQAASTAITEGSAAEAVAAFGSAGKSIGDQASEALMRRATDLAVAVRKAGGSVNAMDPTVMGWAEQGVTVAHVTEAMEVAKQRRESSGEPRQPIGSGYLATILRDVLKPRKPKAPPWWESVASMEAKARELGIRGALPGEEMAAFKTRITAALRKAGEVAA